MKNSIKIEELIYNYLFAHHDFGEEIILTNYFHGDWEADILIIDKNGRSHEIEIKLSKSDFKNDFKKSYTNTNTGETFLKHNKISGGDYICNCFSFLVPMGMVNHNDIPEHCGIIEFYHNPDNWTTDFHHIREPKCLHEDDYWTLIDKDQFMRKLAQNLMFKKFEIKGRHEEFIFPNSIELRRK